MKSKKLLTQNLAAQKKVTVSTESFNVKLKYYSGREEQLTIISKKVEKDPSQAEPRIVEFIPKEVVTSTDDIVFITSGIEVVETDPVFEVDADVDEVTYYIKKKVDLEKIPKIKTLVISMEAGEDASGITGLAFMDNFSSGNKMFFLGEIIVIAILVGIYAFSHIKYAAPVKEQPKEKYVPALIKETWDLVDKEELKEAALKYEELKLLFKSLPVKQKEEYYDSISELCDHINAAYVLYLVDRVIENVANGKIEKASELYEELDIEFEKLTDKKKEEIYPKCCEAATILNNEKI